MFPPDLCRYLKPRLADVSPDPCRYLKPQLANISPRPLSVPQASTSQCFHPYPCWYLIHKYSITAKFALNEESVGIKYTVLMMKPANKYIFPFCLREFHLACYNKRFLDKLNEVP
jgi:hypothetical protein